ncbi:hypothetical protein KUTeg_015620 [Tegillarca granosa]|uniref:Angiotensin-converting enzyme n=1 Tax=Tegillarca granosa TaxID=220873 RepID=A0ABQ9EQL4_TEGGR|nr:hypothetical protein KUTeg_015620 [Tegillarca granosa]
MKQLVLFLGLLFLTQGLCQNDNNKKKSVSNNQLKRLLILLQIVVEENENSDQSLIPWLKDANEKLRKIHENEAYMEFQYETDINDENAQKLNDAGVKAAEVIKIVVSEARRLLRDNPDVDGDAKRQLQRMALDDTPLDSNLVSQLQKIHSDLESIYAKAVIKKDGKTFRMEPELSQIMAKSRDLDELKWAWQGWRDVTGPQMKNLYKELVRITNTSAVENGYTGGRKETWLLNQFGSTENLKNQFQNLWRELKPMYQLLHAFVRKRLKSFYRNKYPGYIFPDDGTIPAHLLGNMWAQQWNNILDVVKPFPNVKTPDVDTALKHRYPKPKDLFQLAEDFYTSIGLYKMTPKFWNGSMIVRPDDREVQCHASAIKMCTEINKDYLETIHHEMGHIEYFMAYRNQPEVYRDGANCGFHEAIGDTIALSVMTRKHLKTIKLIPNKKSFNEHEMDMNFLMEEALSKVAFLPYGYLIDKWRWDVFSGRIKPEDYNKSWWNMRIHYQGVSPPVSRSEQDFDPGAKFHIPADSPYICYFFQFYETLCKESGHSGPLHTAMLELGASKPWPDTLEMFTGSREINAKSIIQYFRPLMTWLKNQVSENEIGWQDN